MNFYADDVAYMERAYGSGWTGEVRQRLAEYVAERKRQAQIIKELTDD